MLKDAFGNDIKTPLQVLREVPQMKEVIKKHEKIERQNFNRRAKRIEARFIERVKKIKESRSK